MAKTGSHDHTFRWDVSTILIAVCILTPSAWSFPDLT